MFSPTPTSQNPDTAVRDVTLATFVADVIEASKTALVLVDFWAPWCGPCKTLTPILEKIARDSKGAIKLAKVDADKNQPIVQQMGVQSLPSVFAFYQGRPVDGFAGALPEAQIKTWLDALLKQTGAPVGDDQMGLDTALQQAADFLAAKDIATAQSIYADILDMQPANPPATAGLLRCLIDSGDITKARQMLDSLVPELAKDKIIAPVRAALEIAEQAQLGAGNAKELESKLAADPADHQTRFDLALACYASGKREQAVDHLLEIVRRARNWKEDAARKQLVKFFEAFGLMDPLTVDARKRLSTLLFS